MLYAIGDLHGDVKQAHAALRLLGLIGEENLWTGGNATLIQTGDLVDRGPESLELVRYFQGLLPQARAAGGRVVTLMGNHEALNVEGDLRYVDRAELAAAGGSEAWSALFDPDGEMGRAVGAYDMAVVAGDGPCRTLFVHAGLRPELLEAEAGADGFARLAALNQRARTELGQVRKLARNIGLFDNEGPVWYRGFAQQEEAGVCAGLWRALQSVGAHRMVVGHTITPSHRTVLTRCGGAFHMIDVGMSKAYYGSLAAWRCASAPAAIGPGRWARVTAHYPRGEARRRPRRAPPPLPQAALLQTSFSTCAAGDCASGGDVVLGEDGGGAKADGLVLERWRPWGAGAPPSKVEPAELARLCAATPGCFGFSAAGEGEEVAGEEVAAAAVAPLEAGGGGGGGGGGGDGGGGGGGGGAEQQLLLLRERGAAAPKLAAPRHAPDTRYTPAEAKWQAARVAAEEPFARRFPSRVASRIGHYVVLLLFVLAACIGWQVRARGHGLRRVASYLNLRPHKTLECNV